eukprot:638246-Pleurochrysis_carterae.AAC.2
MHSEVDVSPEEVPVVDRCSSLRPGTRSDEGLAAVVSCTHFCSSGLTNATGSARHWFSRFRHVSQGCEFVIFLSDGPSARCDVCV